MLLAGGLASGAVDSNKRWLANVFPSWSPDGRMLAFAGYRDGNDDDIYIMSADGSNLRRLTREPAIDSATRASDRPLEELQVSIPFFRSTTQAQTCLTVP